MMTPAVDVATTGTLAPQGLRWGIRRSFVRYVGGLPDGRIITSDGARAEDDDVFWFPADTAATGDGTLRFRGRVELSGHFGMLEATIEAPWLEAGPDGATLTVLDPARGGERRIPLLVLDRDVARAPASSDLECRLTPEGMALFGGQYVAGEAMDPVTLTVADPLGEPRVVTDPTALLRLTVVERVVEADGVISLVMEQPDGAPLPAWTPGAHIDIHVEDLVRQYSLSSRRTGSQWRVTVLREDHGGMSARLHDTVSVGDSLAVSLPRNHFPLVSAQRYIFIAGGIGITPMLPMISQAEDAERAWTLVYSGRDRDRMAFVDDLTSRGDRVTVVDTATTGRVDVTSLLATPTDGTVVYACGPEALLQAVEAAMAAWPPGSLHVERFVPKEFDDSHDVEFEVEFVASGVVATVPVGRSILEVAEDHDVPVISSCSEGTCGTCETPVLSGLPDHRDSILSDEERAENRTMFLCVSRSVGGCSLRLDV